MVDIFIKLCPIFLMFGVGSLLRWSGVVNKRDAALLLRLVFFIALPALILLSMSDISISPALVCLPCVAGGTIFITYGASYGVCYFLKQEKQTAGVALISAMIMNVGFLYPFLLAVYGTTGFVQAVIFDIGNIIVVYTFVYYIACKYGDPFEHSAILLKKVLTSPPVWAIAVALVLRILHIPLPVLVTQSIEPLSALAAPLIMLSLGMSFTPNVARLPLLACTLSIRIGVGFICGLVLTHLFSLQGTPRLVAIVCATAPVGYNTLTFSSLTDLDTEFAASVVSGSIILGIIYIPILVFLMT